MRLVPQSKYPIKCPYKMEPQGITIHNTANDASAEDEIAYMTRNDQKVSFHHAVDDKEAIQGIPENRNAWHAGDGGNGEGNRTQIAIEICYSKSGGERFRRAEDNAAELTKILLDKYRWGIERVHKHQDWSGKYCPHRTLDMGWQRFLDKIVKSEKGVKIQTGTQVNTNGKYNSSIELADVVDQRNDYRETRIKSSHWFDRWVPTHELEVVDRSKEIKLLQNELSKAKSYWDKWKKETVELRDKLSKIDTQVEALEPIIDVIHRLLH